MVFSECATIDVGDLPKTIRTSPVAVAPGAAGQVSDVQIPEGDIPLDAVLEDIEKKLILAAYGRAGGVKAETARILGLKTSALYYKLEKYGIGTKE